MVLTGMSLKTKKGLLASKREKKLLLVTSRRRHDDSISSFVEASTTPLNFLHLCSSFDSSVGRTDVLRGAQKINGNDDCGGGNDLLDRLRKGPAAAIELTKLNQESNSYYLP